MVPWFVRWTRTVSPRWTRIVGPGTVPPNVPAWTTKPLATVMSASTIGRAMWCTGPVSTAGAAASRNVYGGAFGSATGAEPAATGGDEAAVPPLGAGAAPPTVT